MAKRCLSWRDGQIGTVHCEEQDAVKVGCITRQCSHSALASRIQEFAWVRIRAQNTVVHSLLARDRRLV